MKYNVGQYVTVVRGIFKGKRGEIKSIDKRFSSPYLVKINGVRAEHFSVKDLK